MPGLDPPVGAGIGQRRRPLVANTGQVHAQCDRSPDFFWFSFVCPVLVAAELWQHVSDCRPCSEASTSCQPVARGSPHERIPRQSKRDRSPWDLIFFKCGFTKIQEQENRLIGHRASSSLCPPQSRFNLNEGSRPRCVSCGEGDPRRNAVVHFSV